METETLGIYGVEETREQPTVPHLAPQFAPSGPRLQL